MSSSSARSSARRGWRGASRSPRRPASICVLRAGCSVRSSCRCSSVRASFSDSRWRTVPDLPAASGCAPPCAFLQFVHPFLESGISVNQSFAGITHVYYYPISDEVHGSPIICASARRAKEIRNVSCAAIRSISSIHRCASGSAVVRGADAAAAARLAGHRARRIDADPRADRHGQDARGVSCVPRPADVRRRRQNAQARCRVLYVSPLKALAVDVERNLRAPLAGIANVADGRRASPFHPPVIALRTGDTPSSRARAVSARPRRHPDHDAGVAVPDAHVERARAACARSRPSSSTRSTRWCRPSAARTWRCRWSGSRRIVEQAAAAHRAVGDAAAAGRGRAVSRRRAATTHEATRRRTKGTKDTERGSDRPRGRRRPRVRDAAGRGAVSRRDDHRCQRAQAARHPRAGADRGHGQGRGDGGCARRRHGFAAGPPRRRRRRRRSGPRSIRGCSS